MARPGSNPAEQYYTSGLWKQKVDSTLTAIGEIEQPQHPNAQASHAHSQSQSSTVQVNALVQQLSICPTRSNQITSWHFPPQYSQSTLIGRLGSNACTFIALTYCKLYFSSPEPLNSSQPLSSTWIYRVLASILLGNQFYDKAAGNTGQLLVFEKQPRKWSRTGPLEESTFLQSYQSAFAENKHHQQVWPITSIKLVTPTKQLAFTSSTTRMG